MRGFFVKNMIFIVVVNVLVKAVYVFFVDRSVQNSVVPGAYGTYQALFNLSIIFQTLLDFGINSYNSRTIAQNPDRLPEVFPEMLSARLVFMIIYLFIAFLSGYVLQYRGWELGLLIGVLFIQSLNSLVSFVRSNVAALQRFKTDGLLSVSDRLIMIAVCGFLLTYPATAGRFRIEWFVMAQIFAYACAALMGYIILRKIGRVTLRFTFHHRTIWKIVRESFPYALLIFQMSIYNRADAMILERMGPGGKDQASIWAAAFRLLDMANILGLMFATVLLPLFGRMLAKGDSVQPIVKVSVNMMLPFSFAVAVACILYSPQIMHLLYHKNVLYAQESRHYARVFAILVASFPAWCLMYVYSTLLTANGSLKVLNLLAGAGVILNLSLNFYLIPLFRAEGGALTSLITQTALSIAFIIYASRIARLPFTFRWISAHLGYMVLAAAIGFGISRYIPLGWVFQIVIFGLLCGGLMFILHFVSLSNLQQLMGNRLGAGQEQQ